MERTPNSPQIFMSFVRYSLLQFHLSHGSSSSSSSSLSQLASSLTRSVFHSELRLGWFANPFPYRSFRFLPDWFHGLILLNCWMFAWCVPEPSIKLNLIDGSGVYCVRLSRLLVGFRTHSHRRDTRKWSDHYRTRTRTRCTFIDHFI